MISGLKDEICSLAERQGDTHGDIECLRRIQRLCVPFVLLALLHATVSSLPLALLITRSLFCCCSCCCCCLSCCSAAKGAP